MSSNIPLLIQDTPININLLKNFELSGKSIVCDVQNQKQKKLPCVVAFFSNEPIKLFSGKDLAEHLKKSTLHPITNDSFKSIYWYAANFFAKDRFEQVAMTTGLTPEIEYLIEGSYGIKSERGSNFYKAAENCTQKNKIPLLKLAIRNHCPEAKVELALEYQKTNERFQKADALLKEAIDEGSVKALYEWLIHPRRRTRPLLENVPDNLVANILSQAEKGDIDAIFCCGSYYYIFDQVDKIIAALTIIADYHAPSKFLLGLCYESGCGVKQDIKKAHECFFQSAEGGYARAQYWIGFNYEAGENYKEALKYYLKAADQGYCYAEYRTGFCYRHGHGAPRNHKQAFKWFLSAGEQEFEEAFFALGLCYYEGKGTDKNLELAAEWFEKAKNAGNQYAVNYLLKIAMKNRKKTTTLPLTKLKSALGGIL